MLDSSPGQSLSVGVDLVELDRRARAVARFGDRFLARIYTPEELRRYRERLPELAARFAAKEAVTKALGTGIWREGIGWTDIAVGRDVETGAPILKLYGAAQRRADALGLSTWSISLSHDRERAIAFVVAMGEA